MLIFIAATAPRHAPSRHYAADTLRYFVAFISPPMRLLSLFHLLCRAA